MISTFEYQNESEIDMFSKRRINISLQTNGRKKLTIICGFEGGDKDKCTILSKLIKKKFNTGGSNKEDDGRTVMTFQGDIRIQIAELILQSYGYTRDEITISGA